MPDEKNQEKTEQPTQKKIRDARDKGNIAQSQELGNAIVLFAGFMLLSFMGRHILDGLIYSSESIYRNLPSFDLTVDAIPGYFTAGGLFFAKLLAPFSLSVMVIATMTKLVQNGFLLTSKPLELDPKKLDPIKGIKRIFSVRGLMEMLKGVFKLTVISTIGFFAVKAALPVFVRFIDQDIATVLSSVSSTALAIGIRSAVAILALAILDFLFQKWKHNKDLMMSKQEVKDENKQTEGDPLIKQRIRDIQYKMSMNKMINELPTADVIVTNPTHVAVALKYDPETMRAPKVVAKGMRKVAEKIKRIGAEHNIPIVEEPELARALYKSVEIGWEIPYELFQAVAEVLALVYRLRERARGAV